MASSHPLAGRYAGGFDCGRHRTWWKFGKDELSGGGGDDMMSTG